MTDKTQITDENNQSIIESILAGNVHSTSVSFNLKPKEDAFYQFSTERKADVQYMNSYTTGITKQKGVVGRAMVGDLVFGKAGAIIGGVTADSETHSATKQERNIRLETIDSGTMIFTNKRMIFIGKDIVSIPYDDILSIHFSNPTIPHYPDTVTMEVKYPSMIKNECYTLPTTYVEMYFRGVMRHIGKDKSKPKDAEVEKFKDENFTFSDKIIVPINTDGSINCPVCETNIKEYKERWGVFSKTKVFTCTHCGQIILK